jgi:hypothetical protein
MSVKSSGAVLHWRCFVALMRENDPRNSLSGREQLIEQGRAVLTKSQDSTVQPQNGGRSENSHDSSNNH